MIFTEDISGYPVPSSEDYVYFIGSKIAKVDLANRNVEMLMKPVQSDNSTAVIYNRGVLNNDETILLVFSTSSSSN